MGHIQKRTQAGTLRWRARYRSPDGVERSRSFTRRADAERFLAEVETDKVRGTWTNPALAQIRFDRWADQWLRTTTHLKPKTLVGYESMFCGTDSCRGSARCRSARSGRSSSARWTIAPAARSERIELPAGIPPPRSHPPRPPSKTDVFRRHHASESSCPGRRRSRWPTSTLVNSENFSL